MRHATGRAIADFSLVNEGDSICVGISGGKDSLLMLMLLIELQQRAPVCFRLQPVTVDPGFDGFDIGLIRESVTRLGLELFVEVTSHADIISSRLRPGSSYCSFCARLKRGALYGAARKLGCNLLALGHHRNDFIETLLLNQFFIGTIKAMSPRMLCDSGDITVIRPLVYLDEDDIAIAVEQSGLKPVSCNCPVSDRDQQRQRIKRLLNDLEQEIPRIRNSLLAALGNLQPNHLLTKRMAL